MANVITAGNSSNGGTAITTDTSGTLNIVTGSGSGANAITIDSSQNVTFANAISVAGNGTVSGNLTVTGTITGSNTGSLGVGQTWQAVSRTAGTTYTNTTGKPIMVELIWSPGGASGQFTFTTQGVSRTQNINATSTVSWTFIIPPSATYVYSVANANVVSAYNELR